MNENISRTKFIACSFLVLMAKIGKKFCCVCVFVCVCKHLDVVCISILMLRISLKLADLNIDFYDVLFSYKKGSKRSI